MKKKNLEKDQEGSKFEKGGVLPEDNPTQQLK